jgi:two-component system cell cycle response regulator CtrA
MNILIVEDDDLIAESIAMALEDEGTFYHITSTVDEGLSAVREGQYDAVVLDINLPDGDGFQFAKAIQRSQIITSILVVSGRASVTDKVVALHSGADGFLTKPFDRQELIANLTAIIRRANGHSDNKIVTGPIIVDLSKHEVMMGENRLDLTSKEYRILELLSLRKGSTLGKSHFVSHLYGGIDEPVSKIIDVFICKLRRKLIESTGGDNYIHSVWGQGYVLRDVASH